MLRHCALFVYLLISVGKSRGALSQSTVAFVWLHDSHKQRERERERGRYAWRKASQHE